MNYHIIAEFLLNGSERWTITQANERAISGWQELTLVSYNAAVKKFHKFKLSIGEYQYELPLTPNNIYQFVAWAGRGEDNNGSTKILASSLTKYLHGLKAWHTFTARKSGSDGCIQVYIGCGHPIQTRARATE
ncbi:hypothetical protein PCANC_03725 [Puccinia coronata f. sp. avenae]|uniref:Uncharacterized protein n=1 Tax=Puccinia coronata f. sp. avenae TaxID=200324 RepID=A0A2N5VXP2_9BASI|nr:hypothetical protein PCANC_03725 [Puccinia coronata f. sp. avenae]